MEEFTGQHMLVAALEVNGDLGQAEIARLLGKDRNWVYRIQLHPLYKKRLSILRDTIAGDSSNSKKIFEKYLNSRVFDALKAVVDLSENADKDSVRLKAALEILDRAPDGPKKVEAGGAGGVLIQIGQAQIGEIKEVMKELGEDDIVELLEVEEGEWQAGGEEGGSEYNKIIPKEVD